MSEWKVPTDFPDLRSASIIGIDVETKDPNLMTMGPGGVRGDGYLLGVAIATSDFNCYYPMRHESGDNVDIQKFVAYLKDNLSTRCPKVGANILYDLEWLRAEGIRVDGPKYDIQIAEWLLDEEKREYNLNSLCLQYLKKTKFEVRLEVAAERLGIAKSKIKENLWRMHPKDVAEYGAADAKDALDIFNIQVPLLTADELDNLFYNIETPIIDVLLDMRFKGVPVDTKKAEEVRDMLLKKQCQSVIQLSKLVGGEIDVWSGNSIASGASTLGLQFNYTAKGNPSFESSWLEEQSSEYYKLISRIRKLDRSGSVFVESKIMGMAKNGRVYPTFRQSKTDDGGTKSGRFASANPNAQQVPARDEELAPLIRSLFIAEQGGRWGKFDYKQQEPRVTVHYAYLSNLIGAKEAQARYLSAPETDYHQMVADMAEIERGVAKTMNLGLAYGMGMTKMADQLGMSMNQAKLIYNKYHANVPFVKALTTKAGNLAETRGYIKTLAGRRKRFNLWGPKKWAPGIIPKKKEEAMLEFEYPIVRYFTYRAMNSLIQGSCADMLKVAMIDVWEAGYVPSLTVHDELDFVDLVEDKQFKEISDIMINCLEKHGMPITVPLLVDVFSGPSWGEAKGIKV